MMTVAGEGGSPEAGSTSQSTQTQIVLLPTTVGGLVRRLGDELSCPIW